MLHSLKDLQKFNLIAQDGEFGEVNTFLVDDHDWVVRYLVAQVGSRQVLLPVAGVNQFDQWAHRVRLNLSRDRVMNSPEIDVDRVLTRRTERGLFDYYDWPYYWAEDEVPKTLPGDLTAVPLIEMQLEKEEAEEDLIPETGRDKDPDLHLRSVSAITGYSIHAENDDRRGGRLDDLIINDVDWSILYMVIETGGLLSGKKVLMAPTWVKEIDQKEQEIRVDLKADTIHNCPEYQSIKELSDEYQSRLRDHYRQGM